MLWTSCPTASAVGISTAQVEVPLPAVQALEGMRSFVFSTASEVLAALRKRSSGLCADLSAGLGLDSYLSSLTSILFKSRLPAINANADCSTQTIAWSSPGQLPANAPVGFEVGAEANARAIAGTELSVAASKVTGSASAGCTAITNCQPQPTTPAPTPTTIPGGTPASFSGNYNGGISVQSDGQEFARLSISVPPTGNLGLNAKAA